MMHSFVGNVLCVTRSFPMVSQSSLLTAEVGEF